MENSGLNVLKESLVDSLDFSKFEGYFQDDHELSPLSKTLSELDFKEQFMGFKRAKFFEIDPSYQYIIERTNFKNFDPVIVKSIKEVFLRFLPLFPICFVFFLSGDLISALILSFFTLFFFSITIYAPLRCLLHKIGSPLKIKNDYKIKMKAEPTLDEIHGFWRLIYKESLIPLLSKVEPYKKEVEAEITKAKNLLEKSYSLKLDSDLLESLKLKIKSLHNKVDEINSFILKLKEVSLSMGASLDILDTLIKKETKLMETSNKRLKVSQEVQAYLSGEAQDVLNTDLGGEALIILEAFSSTLNYRLDFKDALENL